MFRVEGSFMSVRAGIRGMQSISVFVALVCSAVPRASLNPGAENYSPQA